MQPSFKIQLSWRKNDTTVIIQRNIKMAYEFGIVVICLRKHIYRDTGYKLACITKAAVCHAAANAEVLVIDYKSVFPRVSKTIVPVSFLFYSFALTSYIHNFK